MRTLIVLSELETLANDIKVVVEEEREWFNRTEQILKNREKAKGQGQPMSAVALAPSKSFLAPELSYFLARLNTIKCYLEDRAQFVNI